MSSLRVDVPDNFIEVGKKVDEGIKN